MATGGCFEFQLDDDSLVHLIQLEEHLLATKTMIRNIRTKSITKRVEYTNETKGRKKSIEVLREINASEQNIMMICSIT